METQTKTVEQMSDSFARPDAQAMFSTWAERVEQEARREEKKEKVGPRDVSLKDRPDDEREWLEKVGQKVGEKESRGESSAEKQAGARTEQRPNSGKSTGSESADSRVAPKEHGKLAGAELDNRWRQVAASGNPAWQKAHPTFQAELVKVLGGVDNQNDVMQYLAAHPEELNNVKDVPGLQAAVHQVATREAMNAEVKQATVRHPDAAEKIRSATSEIMADRTPLFVKVFVNESEVIGELLYTLADQATLNKLIQTAKTNPGKALRVLHHMELDIRKTLSNEKASQRTPRAPKPPSEVGGRGAAHGDSTRDAENFSSFSESMKRRYAHR